MLKSEIALILFVNEVDPLMIDAATLTVDCLASKRLSISMPIVIILLSSSKGVPYNAFVAVRKKSRTMHGRYFITVKTISKIRAEKEDTYQCDRSFIPVVIKCVLPLKLETSI